MSRRNPNSTGYVRAKIARQNRAKRNPGKGPTEAQLRSVLPEMVAQAESIKRSRERFAQDPQWMMDRFIRESTYREIDEMTRFLQVARKRQWYDEDLAVVRQFASWRMPDEISQAWKNPSTTPDRRKRWSGGDQEAIAYLESRDYTLEDDWSWSPPFPGHSPTEKEKDAIIYLIEEWDFDGLRE